MVVYYADVYFGVNALMDLTALLLTSICCRRSVKKRWFFCGGAVGALGATLVLFLPVKKGILSLLFGLGAMAMAIKVTFWPKSLREWLRLWLVCLLMAVCLAGVAGWVQQQTNAIYGMRQAAKGMTLSLLLASGCSCYGLVRLCRLLLPGLLPEGVQQETLRLWLGEKSTVVEAFLDTGNFLRQDAKGRPVVIVSFRGIEPLLPLWVRQLFLQQAPAKELAEALRTAGLESGCLSYRAMGNEKGQLPMVVLDRGECLLRGKTLAPLVAAIHNGSFGQAGEAILHPSLVD